MCVGQLVFYSMQHGGTQNCVNARLGNGSPTGCQQQRQTRSGDSGLLATSTTTLTKKEGMSQ